MGTKQLLNLQQAYIINQLLLEIIKAFSTYTISN